MRQYLAQLCSQAGFDLAPARLDALWRYEQALLEKNQVMNLTAITDPKEAARLHIVDALELTRAADLRGKTVLDVGTGGGVPGVVLKLAEPSLRLTLLDATAKKLDWLRELLGQMDVKADFILGRAEEAIQGRRAKYDVVTARAVARLPALCELCLPFVKRGGVFLAMKGPEGETELAESQNALKLLGASALPLHAYTLPATEAGGGEHRTICRLEKTAPTPAVYPRRWSKIKDAPL